LPELPQHMGANALYPLFYWTGILTLVGWAALSAYSAISGF
jgi:hypothetical protein